MSTPCAKCGYTAAIDIEVPIPPVPALQLESDQIASTSETLVIYDTIAAAEANISRIDDETTRLQAVLDGLARKRAAIHHHVQLHRVLVAPVRRLPPEVLSEIFLQCRETKPIDTSSPYHRAKLDKAPLLLGSVCRRWRAIALSTPRLWTTFALTVRPKHLKYDVLLAKTWLGRSGTCPLSIMLESKGRYQNTMRPLMQVFLRYCERWSDIHLCIPQRVMHALSSAKNRLPRLQKLYIAGSMDESISTFENTPQLRHLHLSPSITPSMIKIPWNQLRYFDTRWRSVGSCLELLQLTPNLEGCTVSNARMDLPNPHPPVQLSHLRAIKIHGNASLLEKLLLPNLRELFVVVDLDSYPLTSAPQLISLLSRCSIEFLSYNSAARPLSDFDMIRILETCPSLEQLDLQNRTPICMSKTLIARLACFRDRENLDMPQLVPKLHTITVDYTPSHFDMLAFADAIESRMKLSGGEDSTSDTAFVTELKTVEIRYIPEQESEFEFLDLAVLSRLRRLKNNGLKISVMQEQEYLL